MANIIRERHCAAANPSINLGDRSIWHPSVLACMWSDEGTNAIVRQVVENITPNQ